MTITTILGDTFDTVSYRAFKTCRHTDKIIDLNREHAKTVLFRAGIELKLPEITTERKNSLPPWRVETL